MTSVSFSLMTVVEVASSLYEILCTYSKEGGVALIKRCLNVGIVDKTCGSANNGEYNYPEPFFGIKLK